MLEVDDFLFVTALLTPPPEVVRRLRGECSSMGVRKGSMVGRRARRWRSDEYVAKLYLLDDTQWRRTFRVTRRLFAKLHSRLETRLRRPGNSGWGKSNSVCWHCLH